MYYSVDRIINDTAVCEGEDMSMVNIPLSKLPSGVKEGSIVVEANGEYILDLEKEKEIRQKNIALQNALFE